MKRRKLVLNLDLSRFNTHEKNELTDALFLLMKKYNSPSAALIDRSTVHPVQAQEMDLSRSMQAAADTGFVKLEVEIIFTNPGLSEIIFTHNDTTRVLSESGAVQFDNVAHGDIINVSSTSLGQVNIQVEGMPTYPESLKLKPGINFDFFTVK